MSIVHVTRRLLLQLLFDLLSFDVMSDEDERDVDIESDLDDDGQGSDG